MSRILPISFNTDMVCVILNGRKTVTRRKMKEITKQPYHIGDVLWAREAWWEESARYIYKADTKLSPSLATLDAIYQFDWNAPKSMPKEAARIWLKVTDIWAERLRDLTVDQAMAEGFGSREKCITALKTIYPGSTDDTWMWAIEFERCEKPEPCILERLE